MVKMQTLLRDSDQHIGADCNPDLRLHCVLAGAQKRLDAQVLLDPFEEQFDLPTVSIPVGNEFWLQREVVGQKRVRLPVWSLTTTRRKALNSLCWSSKP